MGSLFDRAARSAQDWLDAVDMSGAAWGDLATLQKLLELAPAPRSGMALFLFGVYQGRLLAGEPLPCLPSPKIDQYFSYIQ